MKCKRVRRMLTAFVDGELTEEDHRSVSEHLGTCESCREYAGEVRKVISWAGTWQSREPSAGFLTRLRARMREQKASTQTGLVWLPLARRVLAGAAAACVIFLVGYMAGVSFTGGKGPSPRGRSAAKGVPLARKGPSSFVSSAPDQADSERLIVGIQRIKTIFGSKLSDAAYSQLNEVQRVLAAGEGADAEGQLAVVKELQRGEELVRQGRLADGCRVFEEIEQSHPGHALAPYAQMARMLATPQPGYGSEFLDSLYAMVLQDTVIDPREFYGQYARFRAQVAEYGWDKIVESADLLNPLNFLDYVERRLLGGSEAL